MAMPEVLLFAQIPRILLDVFDLNGLGRMGSKGLTYTLKNLSNVLVFWANMAICVSEALSGLSRRIFATSGD